jgi:hypothetical protein
VRESEGGGIHSKAGSHEEAAPTRCLQVSEFTLVAVKSPNSAGDVEKDYVRVISSCQLSV